MKTYIYFVRHAESPFSLDAEQVRGLSERGYAAARKAAAVLAGEEIDAIVSSTFQRAIDTVKPLAELLGKEIMLLEALRERPIGSMRQEISEEELAAAIAKSFEDLDSCLPEGESTREARARAIPAIRELLAQYEGKKIAVGTHGNIMTIILQAFDDRYGFDFWKSTSKPDIYRLQFEGGTLEQVDRLWEPET